MSDRLKGRVESEATRILRARVENLRKALGTALQSLSEDVHLQINTSEWEAEGGANPLQAIRDAVDAIARGSGQREILGAVLQGAVSFYSRSAIFIVKDHHLSGWAGLGFDGEGGVSNESFHGISLKSSGDHLLGRALKRQGLVEAGSEGPGTEPIGALGSIHPKSSAAVPLIVRGRPVAVLYADSGAGEPARQGQALEIVVRTAGLSLERFGHATARRESPVEMVVSGPDRSPSLAGAIPVSRAAAPTAPEEAEMHALLGDITATPRRAGSDDGLSEEERRVQADARRFAKLLVSELLLYNEEAVVLGRKNRDLYQRLRAEIDRSRQSFLARVRNRSGTTQFFEEELVRVLAQGDPALFGN